MKLLTNREKIWKSLLSLVKKNKKIDKTQVIRQLIWRHTAIEWWNKLVWCLVSFFLTVKAFWLILSFQWESTKLVIQMKLTLTINSLAIYLSVVCIYCHRSNVKSEKFTTTTTTTPITTDNHLSWIFFSFGASSLDRSSLKKCHTGIQSR